MKRTLTIELSDEEMSVLESLAEKRSLSKVGVLRQALRLYQAVDLRHERGERMFFGDEQSKMEMVLV